MPTDAAKSTRPLVVLFAHPDDEFGVFPWLTAAIAAGRDVHCWYLTDGAYGGQDPAPRRRESSQVLARLGVPTARLHFLGEELSIPDGGLHTQLERLLPPLIDCARASVNDAELLLTAWEGGHQDHDATHLAGLALARELNWAQVRQFSLYQGAGLPGSLFRVLAPLPQNGPTQSLAVAAMERVRCIVRCTRYRSQWKSFLGLLPAYSWRMLHRHPFQLQPVAPERTSDRPHPGMPLYQRRGGPTWEQFAQATQAWRHPFSPSPSTND